MDIDGIAAKVLHREERFLSGKPLAVFMDVADRQELRSRLALVPAGSIITDWPLRFRTQEGRPIRVLATVEAICGDGEDSEATLEWTVRPLESGSGTDGKAEPASELDEVLGQLAHELNQPLAAIISYARGCILRSRNHQLSKADLESILDSIAAEAHRAGALLRTRVRRSRLEP